MVIWNLQIKSIYMIGHTENDKDKLQYLEQEILLTLAQFQRGLVK